MEDSNSDYQESKIIELEDENYILNLKNDILRYKLIIRKIEKIYESCDILIDKLDENCPICFEKIKSVDYKILRCGHIYNKACYQKIKESNKCSICRTKIKLYSPID